MSKPTTILEVADVISVFITETKSIKAGETTHVVHIKAPGSSVAVIAHSDIQAHQLARKITQALIEHADLSL